MSEHISKVLDKIENKLKLQQELGRTDYKSLRDDD